MRELTIDDRVRERALVLDVASPADGRTLSGYAVRWNEWTQIGGEYLERFAPGSFDDSITAGRVKVVYDHGRDASVGMKPIAALRSLTDDGRGAFYEAELLDAPYALDLLPALRAGQLGSSFRFRVPKGGATISRRPGRSEHNPDGLPEVTVTRADVLEIGPTTFPAYAGSTASVRCADETTAAREPASTEGHNCMQTIEDLLAEIRGLRSRMSEIDSEYEGRSMSPEAQTEWDDSYAAIQEKTGLVDELRARQDRLASIAAEPEAVEHERSAPQIRRSTSVRGDDIYDLSTIRGSALDDSRMAGELRDRAMRSIESASFAATAGDEDRVRSGVEALIEDNPAVARHLLTTGSPNYRSAFRKTIMGQPLTGDEIRAMSLTGASGGFATLPFQLDPTIIKTGALAINPYRDIARTVTVSGTNSWRGVASGAVTASFDTEGSQVSDDSPTYAQPSITCFTARAFVPFSYELGEDYPNLLSDLGGLIAEAKDQLEATEMTHGDGTTEPQGILVGASVAAIPTAAANALALADVYSLDNALPARHQANASIVLNRVTANRIRVLAGTDRAFGPDAQLSPATGTNKQLAYHLLGYPVYQSPDIAGTLVDDAVIAVHGDFSRYVIVDRIGSTVEVVPNLFGANGRPTGQRGLMCHWRVGAGVVDAQAFRKLAVTAA
ncbi:MAG: phage major capsid protein [Solirubrobacteraceae bacterium]|nr:phage major capsid protein [Solirubrobacteraceae bacterium]